MINLSLQKEARLSIRNGLNWLEKNQLKDGSWSNYPAITALVTTAFLKSPFELTEMNTPVISKGIQFILNCQKDDGGIYIDEMKAYNTSICLQALVSINSTVYEEEIRRARDFLASLQLREDRGYSSSDIYFGGIGYDEKGKSDLSNMVWALEAFRDSEKYQKTAEAFGKATGSTSEMNYAATSTDDKIFWESAILFIQRCQNNSATNDQEWAGDDGGFVYSPSESKAGDFTSYGSMTYAGMKSLIYAGVEKGDKRVQAAYQWIRNNYTVDQNPQMGEQGLYYYYHTMSKTLSVYGDDNLIGSDGVNHNWRKELIEKLITVQDGEGFWQNKNNRWWENNKDLVTAYSLLALINALE
jgi:squalene-hopene/tetraprenyl-beta-curcumene cyclase